MIPIKATASVLLASVLWVPVASASAAEPATDDTMTIRVEVPARAGGPVTPTPWPEPRPTEPTAIPDADDQRSGALPATGTDVALAAAAIALAAVVSGALLRRARRRRA